MVKGYKCFNKDFQNRYGDSFYEGQIITSDKKPVYKKSGIHFAKKLEDTLRYFKGMEENVIICEVTALGDIDTYDDEYFGYYDLMCTNILSIDHIMTREEILNYTFSLDSDRLIKFLKGFRLTPLEIKKFKESLGKLSLELATLQYYQENDKEAFKKRFRRINGN